MSLLRKSKKVYYSNLDEKKVTYNKTFWKTIKSLLSDKIVSREYKIVLIYVESDINTVQILNTFFSNVASNLKIKLQNMLTATLFQIKLTIQLLNPL